MGVDTPAIFEGTLAQWIQVKGLQTPAGLNLRPGMGHQQLTIDKVNVGLDATETVVKRVEKRVGMQVIIVGMDFGQRLWLRLKTERHQAYQGESKNLAEPHAHKSST